MGKKYKNKYRVESARAQWWDYGWNGAYFITICTQGRAHFFGEITNGEMDLSPLGVIADILWHEIPGRYPFVDLGEFVVMPNHIHGILIIDKPDGAPVRGTERPGAKRFQNQGAGTVSSILGGYKSAVTKHANRLGLENGWQDGFHDHIIRNAASYQRISNYILNNPRNWNADRFYPKG